MKQESSDTSLRDIPRWAERYARNRTLTGAYLMALFGALMAGVFLFGFLSRHFRQTGQQELMWLCGILFGCCYVGLLLACLVQEAARSDRFERELANVACSARGDLLAALRTMGWGLSTTYAVMWFVLPGMFWFGEQALRAGNRGPAFLWYGLWMASVLGLVILTRVRRGTGMSHPTERLGRWLPRSEGTAVAAAPPIRLRWVDFAMLGFFLIGFLALHMLLVTDRIGIEMMQPASAFFIVPVLIYSGIRSRRHLGLWLWLYAALYAAHALLIVAGVPIQFKGDWQPLNMLLPVCGYGILSALAGQVYSRLALGKLKRLAALPQAAGAEHKGSAC